MPPELILALALMGIALSVIILIKAKNMPQPTPTRKYHSQSPEAWLEEFAGMLAKSQCWNQYEDEYIDDFEVYIEKEPGKRPEVTATIKNNSSDHKGFMIWFMLDGLPVSGQERPEHRMWPHSSLTLSWPAYKAHRSVVQWQEWKSNNLTGRNLVFPEIDRISYKRKIL